MNLDIIVAAIPGRSEAQRGQMRANAAKWLDTGTDTQKAAAQTLLDALETQEAAEQMAFKDRLKAMEPAERVVEAFHVKPPTKNELKVIQALLDNPGSKSTELSETCEWRGNKWHLDFGALCGKRGVYLWPSEPVEKQNKSLLSGILADLDLEENRFTMKPDVVEAFAELGIKPTRGA
jgi:hypothetical protein